MVETVHASALLDASSVHATPGRAWTHAYTDRVDRALRTLLDSFSSRSGTRSGGLALVALGSYARRTLCPRSDVDLLILHDGWGTRDLEALVTAVCYPLWDAGVSVGHAVRTTKEAVKAAGDRVDSTTALTDRRLVAGSVGLADDLSARTGRWLKRRSSRLAEEIAEADSERHRRYGVTAGALEPELKDGIGGLRDLHSLRWAAAVLLGQAGLDPLVGARYLGAQDRAELAHAGDTLLAARCALHLVEDKSVRNQLRLDLQDEVARRLGMADGDELLRAVGLATRTIAHLHARTWPVLLQDATRGRRRRVPPPEVIDRNVVLRDGLVEVDTTARLADDHSLALRATAAAAQRGTVLGRDTAMRLRREVRNQRTLDWDRQAREALLSILASGPAGLPATADADYLGVLDVYLPEWKRVRGRPQRNPLHTFDLDTHLIQSTAWLARVLEGEFDRRHPDIAKGMEDPAALWLGTFLHDVGKAWPGDHSISGETIGREWMLHMGFGGERSDRVARLIRHHLLLPEVATQRDLDDSEEIEAVAITVGDTELLDGLYLLSFADSRATGKPAWSSWKDMLITQLYERVRGVLEGDIGVLARPNAPDVVIRAASRHDVDGDVVRTTIDGLPKRYLRVASVDQIAAHTRLLHAPGGGLVLDLRPGPADGTQVISIAAPDRHSMVADLLGVLAAHSVDVLEARIFTHDHGTALDWFVVAAVPRSRWAAIEDELRQAYDGGVAVATAVETRERSRDARPPVLAEPIPVAISTYPSGSSGRTTRIEARGPDSPGVLYRLTRAISELGLSLLGARIATLGPEVRDAFFVRGPVPADDVLRKALEPAFESAAT